MLSRLKRSLAAFLRTWLEDEHEQSLPDVTPYYKVGDFQVSRVAPWWMVSRISNYEIIDVYSLPRTAVRKAYELSEAEKAGREVDHV